MYYKRKFTPTAPEKYLGNHTNIIMRSSWETMFANWCDRNPQILKWSSEEVVVPYRCPTDNRMHRYYIDFRIQLRDKSGTLKTYLIEVKPSKQTRPPEFPGKRTKRYLVESATFIKNQAKWEAAKQYAADRGWVFKIITEHDLGISS